MRLIFTTDSFEVEFQKYFNIYCDQGNF